MPDMTVPAVPTDRGIRSTTRRTPGTNPISTFSALLNTVRDTGLLRRHRRFYAIMAGALVLALGGIVTGFVLLGDSWFQLLMAAALGLVLTQIAFLGHEASHRQILESGPSNDRVGRILSSGIVGISYSWWMNKHTRHHANPNVIGKDPDVELDTISFLDRDAASAGRLRALITRRQGWWFFPLLTLEGINLHAKSFAHLFGRDHVDGRRIELAMIALRFGVLLVPVFLFLPLGMAFAFIGVQLAVFGVYMGASFAPNHKGMDIIPEGTKLDFLNKQVRTSRNIRGGWAMTILMGGLNFQVEHHLFPSMPRPHLFQAREIVKEHCERESIPYTETSLVQSYRIVVGYLNRVGLQARDPFDCPLVNAYRRA